MLDQMTTNLQAIRRMSLIVLFSSLILSAQVSTDTVTVSITPTDTLTDLYFLYAQGDVSRYSPLNGSAPAGVTTQFAVNTDVGLPIPGAPFFSVIGVYTTSGGTVGLDVALDATDAANLISAGTSFDNAFPSFSGGAVPEDESTLIASMEDPNDPAPAPGGGFAFFGYQVVDIFADTPEQQTPALFPGLNLTGITDADLVTFSNAASGGSVELSIQPAGQETVPEPVTTWLLGAAVLAMSARRFRVSRRELNEK
jgi:hypothetical protein